MSPISVNVHFTHFTLQLAEIGDTVYVPDLRNRAPHFSSTRPSARKVSGADLENFNALDVRAEIGECSIRWRFVPKRERMVD